MAGRHLAVRLAAAAELRRADTAVAGSATALLLDDLAGRTRNLTIGLGLVRALLALGQLPDHVALQQVCARRQAEHVLGQRKLARGLVLQVGHADFNCLGHGSLPLLLSRSEEHTSELQSLMRTAYAG